MGNGRSAQPCVQSHCSASSAAGGLDHRDDMSGWSIGQLVSGLLPPLLVRRLVIAKLSGGTDCTDFLTSARCSGLGLVMLDHWKGLEMWQPVTWTYQPESALAQALHCPPLHD